MLPGRVLEEGARLAKVVEAAATTIEDPVLREAALQYPRAGGKALRPALAVLACEAAGGELAQAEPLGVAVELLHTFSLVHDDLMDNDAVRRGVPAVHKAYDDATAILAGDALFALSFERLGTLPAGSAAGAVLSDFASTARVLCEGQRADMDFETRWPSLDEYEAMIGKKTAALFRCATANGARLAGADAGTVEAFTTYGWNLGMAFQLVDDVLDLTQPTEVLGKPQGSDVLAGKKTHPVIAARDAASPRDAEHLAYVLQGGASAKDVEWALALCERTGALSASRARVQDFLALAGEALSRVEPSTARDELAQVLTWSAERER